MKQVYLEEFLMELTGEEEVSKYRHYFLRWSFKFNSLKDLTIMDPEIGELLISNKYKFLDELTVLINRREIKSNILNKE